MLRYVFNPDQIGLNRSEIGCLASTCFGYGVSRDRPVRVAQPMVSTALLKTGGDDEKWLKYLS
jgi:hypothetical protein